MLTLDYLINEIKIEPFDLFFEFGNAVNGNKTGLSVYVSRLYEFFKEKCNSEILREKIVCDMLSSGCEKHIPDVLKIKDPLYKKAKADLSEKLGNDFSFVICYSENKIFAVTPNEPRDLFGRKKGKYFEI